MLPHIQTRDGLFKGRAEIGISSAAITGPKGSVHRELCEVCEPSELPGASRCAARQGAKFVEIDRILTLLVPNTRSRTRRDLAHRRCCRGHIGTYPHQEFAGQPCRVDFRHALPRLLGPEFLQAQSIAATDRPRSSSTAARSLRMAMSPLVRSSRPLSPPPSLARTGNAPRHRPAAAALAARVPFKNVRRFKWDLPSDCFNLPLLLSMSEFCGPERAGSL